MASGVRYAHAKLKQILKGEGTFRSMSLPSYTDAQGVTATKMHSGYTWNTNNTALQSTCLYRSAMRADPERMTQI